MVDVVLPSFQVGDYVCDAVKTTMPLNVTPTKLLVQPTPEVLEWIFLKVLATDKPGTRAYVRPVASTAGAAQAVQAVAAESKQETPQAAQYVASGASGGSSGSSGPIGSSGSLGKRRRK